MASFNKVILLGNVVRTPELRFTPGSNLAVARSAIAVNRKHKDKEDTMFIDIVVFGKLAEVMEAYCSQGTPIMIEGRLSQNKWEQEGVKRSKHEIIVDTFQLLGQKKTETVPNINQDNSEEYSEDDTPF